MRHRFRQVDVFTGRPFCGNPVAVVFDADGLSADQMQQIARWTNLSETTFVLEPTTRDASYRLRIFTPISELPFAGHPTLGSCAAWRAVTGATQTRFVQECAVGLVPIELADDGALSLRVPNRGASDVDPAVHEALETALGAPAIGLPAIVDVGPRWLVMELESAAHVRALDVDMAALTELGRACDITGVSVFGLEADGGTLEVRSFAPHDGVPEDPVCGSGNGAVAYFRTRDRRLADYVARQGRCIGRDGFVRVTFRSDGVWVGGHAVVCVEGTIAT